MIKRLLSAALLALGLMLPAAGRDYVLHSPDGRLNAIVSVDGGKLYYAVVQDGELVMARSHAALTLAGGRTLGEGIKGEKLVRGTRDPRPGNPVTASLRVGDYSVEFSVLNDAFAYRFSTRMADSLTIAGETVQWMLPGDCPVYLAQANSRDKQATDFKHQAMCSFENTYQHGPLKAMPRDHLAMAPMLACLEGGRKVLLGECDVLDYPGLFLVPGEAAGEVQGWLPPYPKTQHQGGHHNLQMIVDEWQPYVARVAGRRTMPWRMMIVSRTDADLLTSTAPQVLAQPSVLPDTSWVRPGKVAWDWWNAWNLSGVDFRTGVNNDTYKYYIDFAAHNGIEYVILDEGWAVDKQADLMQVVPEIDLPALCAYAKERGVGLVLWAGYRAFDRDMEGVARHYSQMGIKGFKVDFMDRNDQQVMRFLERAAQVCAKYHLFLDFHGAPVPNGFVTTYPNVLNFEAVAGLEQVKWSKFKDFDEVLHETLLPFIRQVAGPMDYTQGAMRNAVKANYHACRTQPMSQGTRCRQLALYMIFNSPFNMLCDSPTQYEANPQCTSFIAGVPVTWDERRVLAASVGEYVVMACRKGNQWWIGGITNWDARDMDLDLSFIAGRQMTLMADGVNSDRIGEDYRMQQLTVPATLHIHMAPGGGFAAQVR